MKAELQAELQRKTLRCPVCSEPVETIYYKRSQYWAVVHGRGNGTLSFTTGETCRLRYEELAQGETRQQAEENFKQQNQ
jgi:C4-type Zn-finger protein